MTMRKHIAIGLVTGLALAAGACMSGCSSRGMTTAEVNQRHNRTIQNNMWQIQEDLDAILMLERPTRLSEQMIR